MSRDTIELKARCWDRLRDRVFDECMDIVYARRLILEMAAIMQSQNATSAAMAEFGRLDKRKERKQE